MTQLDGKTVLRFLAISPVVDFNALMETVSVIRELAEEFTL